MENVLVAGANGTTGRYIVNILKSSPNFNPVAMVRKEEQQKQFKEEGVETVLADLTQDLRHAVKGIDKLVFAAGSGGKNVVEVDQEGAKRLMDVSKTANIKRFVMLSSMGVDHPESVTDLKDYMKAKQNADEHLRNSGLKYTIVRPGALINAEAKGKIELKGKLNKQGKISREDVAQTLVGALDDEAPFNTTFEIIEGDTLIGEALSSFKS